MEIFEKLRDFVTDAKDKIADTVHIGGSSSVDIDSLLHKDRTTTIGGTKPYSASVLEGSKAFSSSFDKSEFAQNNSLQSPMQQFGAQMQQNASSGAGFNPQPFQQTAPQPMQGSNATGPLNPRNSMELASHIGVEHPLSRMINTQQQASYPSSGLQAGSQSTGTYSQGQYPNLSQQPATVPAPQMQFAGSQGMPVSDPYARYQQEFAPAQDISSGGNLDSIRMDIKHLKAQQELILEKLSIIEERTRRFG